MTKEKVYKPAGHADPTCKCYQTDCACWGQTNCNCCYPTCECAPQTDFDIILVPKKIEVSERYNVTETINVPRIEE